MHVLIIWLDAQHAADLDLLGGKASSLARMARAGLPVPRAFAVSTQALRTALEGAGLLRTIDLLTERLDPADPAAAEAVAAEVRGRMRALTLPPDVEASIVSAYEQLCPNNEPVAVRSSATAEDTADASFAGQHDTYLGVEGAQQVLRRVRDCWASYFTDRAVAYRAERGLDYRGIAGAVVVQRLLHAEKAGVMFTVHPVSRNPEVAVVEACWGLGEALVSGEVTPDHYTVSKQTGAVHDVFVMPKRRMVMRTPGSTEVSTLEVPLDRVHARVLSDGELGRLGALASQLEQFFGCPQDVEWAAEAGHVFLLQSRPITTL